MKTRESPPPVHVHVPETTPVHVHMRRSPSKTPQNRTKDVQARGDGSRPRVRSPWIPPGRFSCRRDVDSYKCQRSRAQHQSERDQRGGEEQEEEMAAVTLSVLLREQEGVRRFKRSDSRGQRTDTDVLLRTLVEAEIDGVAVANQLTALKETVDSLAKDKRLSKLHAASVGRQQELLVEKMEMFDHTNQSLRELLREWSEHERDSLVWSEQRDALKKRLDHSETENIRLLAKFTNKEKEASKLAEHLDFEKDNAKTTEELSRILESTRDHLESQLDRAEAEKARLAAQIQRMQQSQEQQQEELRALQDELQTQRQQRWRDNGVQEEAQPESQRRGDDDGEDNKEETQSQRHQQPDDDGDRDDDGDQDETQGRPDREALALLTQQAERAEESVRELTGKLQEKETQLAQALSTSSDWCVRHSNEAAAKQKLEEETSALKLQVTELNSRLQSAEERGRVEREELRDQLHQLSAETASTELHNQRLKAELMSSEEKLRGLQSEARHLKASIKKYESLVEKYKQKVQQARLEAEDHCLQLEAAQKETREAAAGAEREKEQVRRELLGRLRELETLPERLRRSEQQLRDAQREADAHERRNLEHGAALAEVRHKVEQQGAQLEMFQQRNVLLQEENNVLTEKLLNVERRLEDARAENQDMSQALASEEAGVRGVQHQLEEKTLECSALSRQLQQTLDDAQRQVDDNMQKVLAKERVSQSKALDLQSQLSRATTELSQLQRSKAEMERRFQGQLQNMKDRLEQSDSTNRTLQNYVHFLKTSYGNVFGESLLES